MKVSDTDILHLAMIRDNVDMLMKTAAQKHDADRTLVLDIAPEIYEGAKKFFRKSRVDTLDIDHKSNATYICDLADARIIQDNTYDVVFCTEVLEHTNDPFACVKTIHRILKPGGVCYATTPFNFRIHNPLPDNWRFTEHGLRVLFKDFYTLNIEAQEDADRFLMPIQYITIAIKEPE